MFNNCTLISSTFKSFVHQCRRHRTIYALSTGLSPAAVAIVRVSGSQASAVLTKMTKWNDQLQKPNHLFYTALRHPHTGDLLDRAMAVWLPGPASFTGEDCCEFHVHGGRAVVSDILDAIGTLEGCFPAEAGEFTKRAFYNGKLDLTAVEGLADLLKAETSLQKKLALRQSGGDLQRLYDNWRRRLLKCVAHVEAYVDFAEDAAIESNVIIEVNKELRVIREEMKSHLSDARVGERLRDGIRVVIVGEPNVGKSSLLNYICQRPAAIVTPIAGTTRDVLDIPINFGGYPVLLTDTAGIRETEDIVEREGVARAREKLRGADILLIVLDATKIDSNLKADDIVQNIVSAASSPQDDKRSSDAPEIIVVFNKIDLTASNVLPMLHNACDTKQSSSLVPTSISCVSGQGLDDLVTRLQEVIKSLCSGHSSTAAIPPTQPRHRFLVKKAIDSLDKSFANTRDHELVFAAELVRQAAHALGKLTGREINTEEMLDVLFKDFCIGK